MPTAGETTLDALMTPRSAGHRRYVFEDNRDYSRGEPERYTALDQRTYGRTPVRRLETPVPTKDGSLCRYASDWTRLATGYSWRVLA